MSILNGDLPSVCPFDDIFFQLILISRSFAVCLRDYFLIISFISACLMVSSSNNPKELYCFFFRSIPMHSWFCRFIPAAYSLFPFFHYQHGTFFNVKCHSNCLFEYSYCLKGNHKLFSIFINTFMSSIYIMWFILICYFGNLLSPLYFLIPWFSSQIVVAKSSLPWSWIFGFLPLLTFVFLLSIPPFYGIRDFVENFTHF